MLDTVTAPDVEKVVREFNAWDRCDGCGAQAYHAAVKGDKELLFCAHHKNKHQFALIASDWSIQSDEVALKTLTRAPSL